MIEAEGLGRSMQLIRVILSVNRETVSSSLHYGPVIYLWEGEGEGQRDDGEDTDTVWKGVMLTV